MIGRGMPSSQRNAPFMSCSLQGGGDDAGASMPDGVTSAQAAAGDGAERTQDHGRHAPPGNDGGDLGGLRGRGLGVGVADLAVRNRGVVSGGGVGRGRRIPAVQNATDARA